MSPADPTENVFPFDESTEITPSELDEHATLQGDRGAGDLVFAGDKTALEKWPFKAQISDCGQYQLEYVRFYYMRRKYFPSGQKYTWLGFTVEVRDLRGVAVACENLELGVSKGVKPKQLRPPDHKYHYACPGIGSKVEMVNKKVTGHHAWAWWIRGSDGGKPFLIRSGITQH